MIKRPNRIYLRKLVNTTGLGVVISWENLDYPLTITILFALLYIQIYFGKKRSGYTTNTAECYDE